MFKNENGFSLVELAIAAGLAVALAATAVTVLSGTTATLSSNANGAAGTSSQYNTDVLGNASGAAGSSNNGGNTGGNTNNGGNTGDNNFVSAGTVSSLTNGFSPSTMTIMTGGSTTWNETKHFLKMVDVFGGDNTYEFVSSGYYGFATIADLNAYLSAQTGNVDGMNFTATQQQDGSRQYVSPYGVTYTVTSASVIVESGSQIEIFYNIDASGNSIAL